MRHGTIVCHFMYYLMGILQSVSWQISIITTRIFKVFNSFLRKTAITLLFYCRGLSGLEGPSTEVPFSIVLGNHPQSWNQSIDLSKSASKFSLFTLIQSLDQYFLGFLEQESHSFLAHQSIGRLPFQSFSHAKWKSLSKI